MFGLFQKTAFGLDISDTSIEVIQFQGSGKSMKLLAVGRMILAPGLIEDGKILDEQKMAGAIRDLLAKTQPQKVSTNLVVASLPESKIFTHLFKLPASIPEQQLSEALRYEAEGVIPVPASELVFDYKAIRSTDSRIVADKKRGVQDVLHVAVFKDIAQSYVRTLRLAGLEPVAFDAESLSIARSLIKAYNKDEAVLIADVGAKETVLSIFDQDGIRFSRDLGIAGDTFTKTVAEKMKISWDEAENMKLACGLDQNQGDGRVLFILQGILEKIIQEMQKGIRFYEEESGRKVTKVILVGGSANLPSFSLYFEDNLGIQAVRGRPWVVSESSPMSSTLLLTNAIGLALRGVEADPAKAGINLMPKEEAVAKPQQAGKKTGFLGR